MYALFIKSLKFNTTFISQNLSCYLPIFKEFLFKLITQKGKKKKSLLSVTLIFKTCSSPTPRLQQLKIPLFIVLKWLEGCWNASPLLFFLLPSNNFVSIMNRRDSPKSLRVSQRSDNWFRIYSLSTS